MANGSWRNFPIVPTAAAVISEETVAPKNIPCRPIKSFTDKEEPSVERLPPKRMAEMGTPLDLPKLDQSPDIAKLGTVKRELGARPNL